MLQAVSRVRVRVWLAVRRVLEGTSEVCLEARKARRRSRGMILGKDDDMIPLYY